jgi:hypothetical protein
MTIVWWILRTVALTFATVIAILVVIDGTLFANAFRKDSN